MAAVAALSAGAALMPTASAAVARTRPKQPSAATDADTVPGRLIVKTTGAPPQGFSALSATSSPREIAPDTYVIEVDPSKSAAAVDELQHDSSVVYVQPDHIFHIDALPNDTYYASNQAAYLGLINAPTAWDRTLGSAGVVVAVLDTPIDTNQVDLAGKFAGSVNEVMAPVTCPNPDPVNGPTHGTFVAGIVGAQTNNSQGVAGLGWNTKILAVQVLDSQGCGDEADLAKGIRYAADNGANVINLSLGGPGHSATLDSAVTYAEGKGLVIVAAAGNTGTSALEYPAALPGVVSVGASDLTDHRASFSTFGTWVDLMAPGVSILSTKSPQEKSSAFPGGGGLSLK